MTLSYNWLHDYLPLRIEPGELSSILTSIGLEVEGQHAYESVPGGLQGLVVGEVKTCEKHPDADKLKLTQVDIGSGTLLPIVCGAANVAAGQKVVVAPVGCRLFPRTGEPITIRKAKIRGSESQGMICAEDEIGLSDDHEGILVLPNECLPGTPLTDVIPVHRDILFEIGLTPNRTDAMSHLGVARDLCAYLSYHQGQVWAVKDPYPENTSAFNQPCPVNLHMSDATLCPRYAGIRIDGIQVGPSPDWLKERLTSIGLKSLNNIVDITQFILHECGQPLHAFDMAAIEGNQIHVRTASSGERFVTLDGKERRMNGGELLIGDEHKALCLAGVYGGRNSGVTEGTRSLFLESACFDRTSIRKTSLSHELRTDAAVRFEKGVDIGRVRRALERAALLVLELAGGQVNGGITDLYPAPVEAPRIRLDFAYLTRLSGKTYDPRSVQTLLESLGFRVTATNPDGLDLEPPSHKTDIHIPADLVEEIMRIDGLDQIPIPSAITLSPSVSPNRDWTTVKSRLSAYLTGMGFSEILTNSITHSGYYPGADPERLVRMKNSLSSELDILRPDMLCSGLEVIAHNLNRKQERLRLYEFGKTYQVDSGSYAETEHLSLYLSGDWNAPSWRGKSEPADIFHLKGVLEGLLSQAVGQPLRIEVESDADLEPGGSCYIGSRRVGRIGRVAPAWLNRFGIRQAVYYADLVTEALRQERPAPLRNRDLPKYPAVVRDLALVVDKNVSYYQAEQIALSGKNKKLRSVSLFDVFENEKLGAGKKSMALSFTFQDEEKTLTDNDIDRYMQELVNAYESQLNATIRK